MSGEPPEPNRQQMTDSVPPQQTGSAPVRGFVTTAPTVLQGRLGTHGNWLLLGASSVGGPQIYPAMSGEAPEPNRKQMHYVPIAPGFQEQLGTLAIWLPSGASSPTAGVSGVALSKTKKEPGALTGKSVVVLKPCDVVVRNETVFMPNTIEMAQLKKTEKGQFKKNVQFSSKMTEMDVKRRLVATFPFLDCQRFYCAAAADNRTRLDFHGERRIWDGRFLKQVIKGNSTLYIFAEEDSTGARQIEASGSDNPSLSASSKPITPSINNKSIKPSAACSYTGAHLWSVRTVAETAAATVTTLVHPMSSPSLAIENQHTQNAIPTSSVCATQVSTQSMLRRSYEGYDQSSKKRKRAGNVSKHSKSNTVNRLRRKRSHTMTSSNSVPMSVSCPVASDQQCLEQPISPVTGAVTDTSMLAAQMENLGFREKAGSSGKRVDNGADSRPDDQSTPLPTGETSELGGQPHNGWSLGASSYSLTGEQSYFTDQLTLDELYRDRVGVSIQELDSIPRMEINRLQETGPRAQGFTEGSDHYNTSSDVNATSSGICSDDGDLVSSDQSNSENLSQDQPIRRETNQDFKPEVNPRRVPFYQGAPVFVVKFEHPPSSEVQSLRAKFESLGHVLLRRLNDDTFLGERMPAASRPCVVKVSVESESGRPLGETEVEYFDDPSIYATLFRHLAIKYDESNGHVHGDTSNSANGGSSNGNTQGDTGSSGNGGFTQQLQSLQHLVNAMVASGAQWLIEPIFKSTAGRMLLHSYKETSQLPEVIARENGHEETARFLADITQRLSEETEFFPDDVQKIDWSELVFLVERAQEQKIGGIVVDQENYQAENDLTIDTGYFGDVETSSGNLSPQSKSDSDDNSSEISFEDSFEEDETQLKTDAFKTYSGEKADLPFPDLSDVNFPKEGKTEDTLFQRNKGVNAMENLNKDRSLQLALHSPATGSSGCLMSLNDVNGKGRRYKNTGICKENFFLQMLPDLQNGKSVYRHGVSVLLKLASEDISRHLSTMHERWITRIQLNKNLTEETTQLLSVVMRKNELNPAEGGSTSVTQPAATMKSNFVQEFKESQQEPSPSNPPVTYFSMFYDYLPENDALVSAIKLSKLIALFEMDEPSPEMTSLLSPSSVDGYLTAQASNIVELQNQNQRDNTIQLPKPPEATQTQVSHGMRGNDSDSGLGSPSSSMSEEIFLDVFRKETQPAHCRLKDSTVSLKESVTMERVSDQPFLTSSDSVLHFGKNGKFSGIPTTQRTQRKKDSKLLQGARQPIICFLLTMNTESINRCLSTWEDRWRIQLQLQRLSGRMTTSHLSMLFQAMHIKQDEALKSLITDAGLSTPSDNTTRAACEPFDSPLPSNNSTPSDVVALTSVYCLSRKILLSFVSNRNGFLPPESWLEDEDCELLMECWKWRRCKNNFFAQKLIEIKDQPASSGIRVQGRLAARVYKRPLWEEKGIVKSVPENFIGRNWTGKTSLKTSLVWRTNKSRNNTEPEPEFLFEEETPKLTVKRSLKKVKSDSSYAEDFSCNPNCSLTVPLKVIGKAKELSKPTDLLPQDCKQEKKAKDDSEEPSIRWIVPSRKLRVPKQPEDVEDCLMSSVYSSLIINTNHRETLSCALADNPYNYAKPKVLVESSYGTLKDNVYCNCRKDPFVVDNKTSESSQNVIGKAKELSKPTDLLPQDCKQEKKAKDDSQEPSARGIVPSRKLRVSKQPEDIEDYLMSSVYPRAYYKH